MWVKKGVMHMEENKRGDRRKFALWAKNSTLDSVKKFYKEDDCESQSEFIEKAILFYLGYLLTEKSKSYLPNVVTSTLKGIVAESDHKQNRMLFKLAVEMAMMMNVIASSQNIDKVSLESLRGECVKEVKRTNGNFSLEDAVDWQKG